MSRAYTPSEDPAVLATQHAPAKIILLGEHFVVHGAVAIAAPLSALKTTVVIRTNESGLALDVEIPTRHRHAVERLVQTALKELELGDPPWRIIVRSSIPLGWGLGSSAAFAVALVRALQQAAGKTPGTDAATAAAHALERLVHGTPSGIDDTVVARGTPIQFSKGTGAKDLKLGAPLYLALGGIEPAGHTRSALAQVSQMAATDPHQLRALCKSAQRLSQAGVPACTGGDYTALGTLFDESHELLQQLGVSTPQLDELVRVARGTGALGAKLTGAGLGGFVIAIAKNPEHGRTIAQAMTANGAQRALHTTLGA